MKENSELDGLVLFKEKSLLELKIELFSMPKGATGGGDLPYHTVCLNKAIELHRLYNSRKLTLNSK